LRLSVSVPVRIWRHIRSLTTHNRYHFPGPGGRLPSLHGPNYCVRLSLDETQAFRRAGKAGDWGGPTLSRAEAAIRHVGSAGNSNIPVLDGMDVARIHQH